MKRKALAMTLIAALSTFASGCTYTAHGKRLKGTFTVSNNTETRTELKALGAGRFRVDTVETCDRQSLSIEESAKFTLVNGASVAGFVVLGAASAASIGGLVWVAGLDSDEDKTLPSVLFLGGIATLLLMGLFLSDMDDTPNRNGDDLWREGHQPSGSSKFITSPSTSYTEECPEVGKTESPFENKRIEVVVTAGEAEVLRTSTFADSSATFDLGALGSQLNRTASICGRDDLEIAVFAQSSMEEAQIRREKLGSEQRVTNLKLNGIANRCAGLFADICRTGTPGSDTRRACSHIENVLRGHSDINQSLLPTEAVTAARILDSQRHECSANDDRSACEAVARKTKDEQERLVAQNRIEDIEEEELQDLADQCFNSGYGASCREVAARTTDTNERSRALAKIEEISAEAERRERERQRQRRHDDLFSRCAGMSQFDRNIAACETFITIADADDYRRDRALRFIEEEREEQARTARARRDSERAAQASADAWQDSIDSIREGGDRINRQLKENHERTMELQQQAREERERQERERARTQRERDAAIERQRAEQRRRTELQRQLQEQQAREAKKQREEAAERRRRAAESQRQYEEEQRREVERDKERERRRTLRRQDELAGRDPAARYASDNSRDGTSSEADRSKSPEGEAPSLGPPLSGNFTVSLYHEAPNSDEVEIKPITVDENRLGRFAYTYSKKGSTRGSSTGRYFNLAFYPIQTETRLNIEVQYLVTCMETRFKEPSSSTGTASRSSLVKRFGAWAYPMGTGYMTMCWRPMGEVQVEYTITPLPD